MLNRGRTNHNFGKRVTYLHCNHEGCNAKLRLTKRLLVDSVILESAVGYEHHHVLEQVPGRGLSNEQKEIILECYSRDCGAPKKVCITCGFSSKLVNFKRHSNLYMKVVREFTRSTQGNNVPPIPTLVISMISSFLTYQRKKERGGRLVGGQSTEDILAFAAANRSTETTLRNDGFCVHLTVDTERDDPFFALLISTRGLLEGLNNSIPLETDETYKLMLEGFPLTVIGQSDMNRQFHV